MGRSFFQRIPAQCGVSESDHEASMRRLCQLIFWECGFESLCDHGCLSRVLLGRGLCYGPIVLPEDSCPVWFV